MQKIYKIITQLISSAIMDTPTNVKYEDINFESLFSLSESLEVSPVVGYSLYKNGLLQNEEYKVHFKNTQMIALYRFMQSENEYTSICSCLDEAKVDYMPLKGAIISEYYPEKHLRTKSDIDILIKKSDVEKVSDIFESKLGYTKGEKNAHDISFFSKSGYHIELHFSLSDGDEVADKILNDVWNNAHSSIDNPHHYYMTGEFFAFYHIVHAAKHILGGGCGIKPVVDMWIIKNKMGYDEKKLFSMLEKSSLKNFYDEFIYLADVWFLKTHHSDISKKFEDFLFKSGVYGNLENNIAISQLKKGGKTGYILSKTFLNYKDMAVYYPSLEKCPLLFPFYQVRRWMRIAFFGGANIAKKQIRVNQTADSGKISEISELINKLGL
jgi:hypothetical protein